jgi:DNA replication protein DnaC
MLLKLPGNPPGIRLLTQEEADRLGAIYPARELPPPSECITCGGKKTFRWWSHAAEGWHPGDAVEVSEFECPCIEQYRLHRFFLYCNIGKAYQRLGWQDFEGDERGRAIAQEWLAKAGAYIDSGAGIIFRGAPGTGKTLLGILALKSLIAESFDCYFTTFNEMLDKFQDTWRDPEERRWFYRRVKNTTVLLMDDPGKEAPARSGSGQPVAAMDELLRHRIAASLPTFVMTNDSKEKFEFRYGSYIASLLTERNAGIVLQGEDYRSKVMDRIRSEVDLGIKRPLVLR